MKNKKITYIIIIFLIIILIIISNKYANKNISLSEETIYSNKIPKSFDNYKILQLSDLHSEEFGKDNFKLIEKINHINPDVIMITGDMFSSSEMEDKNMDETTLPSFSLIKNLSKSYKIIYVTGNHEEGVDVTFNNADYKKRDRNSDNSYNRYINKLKSMGVIFVDNTYTQLTKGSDSIDVYGIYYYTAEQINSNYYLKYNPINKDNFNIILCHDPKYFETLVDNGFDLVLSGHIHGGIIRIPFLGGLLSPDIAFFPKYNKGLYSYGTSYLNVSSGLGNNRLFRINNPPQINLITLKVG